jgi:3-hydroxyisobutyrate dehydrogenase
MAWNVRFLSGQGFDSAGAVPAVCQQSQVHKVITMKIGWIGTGIMGVSMAGHLQFAGHELLLYNRTRDKAKPLVDRGGRWCTTPAAVAAAAEVLFTMVGIPLDVEEAYLGPQGILASEPRCRIVVDMTTSEPALARRIAKAAVKKGIFSLDAPVSGGDVGARNATLAIMVGGDRKIYEEALPLLQHMGKTIAWMGGPGAGQHTKMCNQILIAGTMIGVCEALLYASKSGLDEQAVIDIIGKGAASSWCINTLGPRIAQGDYRPGFYVDHFIKDMGIALREAAAMGLALPGLALVHQLYVAAKAQGHGESGTQALMLALRQLNRSKDKEESAT